MPTFPTDNRNTTKSIKPKKYLKNKYDYTLQNIICDLYMVVAHNVIMCDTM